MKTTNSYRILASLVLAMTFTSCVEDGDFTVPNVTVEEPAITANSSIAAVQSALQQEYNSNDNLVYTFDIDEANPTYFEGYVVSSDATGNFYKKIIVQDAPANPTAGLEMIIDKSALHESFEVGRKIYVKLDGLSVSYDDGESSSYINPTNNIPGKYLLGVLEGTSVENLPGTSISAHIFRSATVVDIVPTSLSLAAITGANMNTMVALSNAQFEKTQLGKTFAGEANDEYDGFRTLFDCDTEQTLKLQTSTYASFKSNVVPGGKGSIRAVLTKDYRAEFFVAIINTPSDIDFTNTDRCDPEVLDCGTGSVGGSVSVFSEDFGSILTSTALTAAGWTNVNTNGGSTLFSPRTYGGNSYVQMSAYNCNENPLEGWLVSPAINLDNTTDEALSFTTNTGYDNGAALTVFVSSDFTGDVTTATWMQVDATLSEGPSSGYGSSFTASGNINISCLEGNMHVAFRYLGGDGDVTTTFQVDDIAVTGN